MSGDNLRICAWTDKLIRNSDDFGYELKPHELVYVLKEYGNRLTHGMCREAYELMKYDK